MRGWVTMSEFPSHWRILPLEEVMDAIIDYRGKTPKKTGSGIPLITAKIVKGGRLLKPSEYIAEDDYDSWMVRGLPEAGDIVVTTEAPLGEVAQLDDANIALAQRIVTLRGKKGVLNNDFLFCAMQSDYVQNQLESRASGSTVKGIKQSELRKVLLPIPPEGEQLRIANHIKLISNKLEVNRQTNQTLETIAQTLFKSWFVDFDPVKAKLSVLAAGGSAEEAERAAMCAISARDEASLNTLQTEQPEAYAELARTAALFPSAMQNSELGEIPHSWEFKKLKDICRVLNGRAYKNTEFKSHGTPIVRIQNLSNGGKTVYSDLDLPKDKLIDKEDFIYAWSATFGPHIWRGPKSIYHYHIWKMDVNEDVVSRYFLYLSMFRKTEQMKNGATGSIFTHLTKSIMEDQDILIATPELNMAFKATMETYFHQITALTKEVTLLESLRDSLLPKLLSGELTLPDKTPSQTKPPENAMLKKQPLTMGVA